MMEPTRRPSAGRPGWNEQAAVAILVVCARHLLAAEPPPLTPDRLARLVAESTFPQLVALCAQSPDARVRDDAARLRRLVLAGQVVYDGVMQGLPTALGDPFWAEIVEPPLTVLAQPVRRMAECVVKLLLERIETGRTDARRIVFACDLIERASVRRHSL